MHQGKDTKLPAGNMLYEVFWPMTPGGFGCEDFSFIQRMVSVHWAFWASPFVTHTTLCSKIVGCLTRGPRGDYCNVQTMYNHQTYCCWSSSVFSLCESSDLGLAVAVSLTIAVTMTINRSQSEPYVRRRDRPTYLLLAMHIKHHDCPEVIA